MPLLEVEYHERSGRNNGLDLAIEVRSISVGILSKSQMMMSGAKDPLRALPWYQCFTCMRVGPASCATLMNCYSGMNLVTQSMVDALNLSLIEHPEPYELWWKDKFVKIMHRVEVRFILCGYGDLVMCDVLPMHMHTCSILLGKPCTDKR